MKVICVANQKGGVSKTTTTYFLSEGLVARGYKVLRIDLDPQGNLTSLYNVKGSANIYDIVDSYRKDEVLENAITKLGENSYIIPASPIMSEADVIFRGSARNFLLKDSLVDYVEDFDYVLIDCPTNLGILIINALVYSNEVIIPMLAADFSSDGYKYFLATIKEVRKHDNPNLKVNGALITNYNSRVNIHRECKAQIEEKLGQYDIKVYNQTVRYSTVAQKIIVEARKVVKEDGEETFNMLDKFKNENVVCDYLGFVDEFLKAEENEKEG